MTIAAFSQDPDLSPPQRSTRPYECYQSEAHALILYLDPAKSNSTGSEDRSQDTLLLGTYAELRQSQNKLRDVRVKPGLVLHGGRPQTGIPANSPWVQIQLTTICSTPAMLATIYQSTRVTRGTHIRRYELLAQSQKQALLEEDRVGLMGGILECLDDVATARFPINRREHRSVETRRMITRRKRDYKRGWQQLRKVGINGKAAVISYVRQQISRNAGRSCYRRATEMAGLMRFILENDLVGTSASLRAVKIDPSVLAVTVNLWSHGIHLWWNKNIAADADEG